MEQFRKDVIDGLGQSPKKLPSRYFYDVKGDTLFQQIMQLEEYYLPRCEMEIINEKSSEIAQSILAHTNHLEVIELGAGDGSKSVHLLKSFIEKNLNTVYRPLDISSNILVENSHYIHQKIPDIQIIPEAGNYFETYPKLTKLVPNRLVLFLGSNIGNFTLDEADEFIKLIGNKFETNDYLLIAFDLVKNPRKILAAYDDSKGVTANFNLNLLTRINNELGANFVLENFIHYPYYNPQNGITYSYLLSTIQQSVQLDSGDVFKFEKHEPIQTEISKKYYKHEVEYLAKNSGLALDKWFYDSEEQYAIVLMRKGT